MNRQPLHRFAASCRPQGRRLSRRAVKLKRRAFSQKSIHDPDPLACASSVTCRPGLGSEGTPRQPRPEAEGTATPVLTMADLEFSVSANGLMHTLRLRPTERVGTLRARLATAVGMPSNAPPLELVCNGLRCTDDAAHLATLPGRALTAWAPRYSRHISDAAGAQAAVRAAERSHYEAHKLKIEARAFCISALQQAGALASAARRQTPMVSRQLARVERRTWGRLALWIGLTMISRELGLAMPFLIAAAIYAIFNNLGSNNGGESAYTVFNGMRALPGQVRAEDIQRDMMRGVML